MLNPEGLTFNAVYDAYVQLLEANPGKALVFSGESVLFLDGKEVCEAPLKDGFVDLEFASCIDPRAWCADECCWQHDDDSAMTVAVVNSPRWAEYQIKPK